MENTRIDKPDIEEKPYITDLPKSNKPRKFRFRTPTLKYGGGILAVIGIFWTLFAIANTGTPVGRVILIDSLPGLDVLALPLLTILVGFLLYNFIDE